MEQDETCGGRIEMLRIFWSGSVERRVHLEVLGLGLVRGGEVMETFSVLKGGHMSSARSCYAHIELWHHV